MQIPSFAGVCQAILAVVLLVVGRADGQELIEWDSDLADRPIASLVVAGAPEKDEQLIRNNARAAVGDPYDADAVRGDVNRIYRLGRFKYVTAEVRLNETGTVNVIYSVTMQPLIKTVQTVGNKAINDQELRGLIRVVPGGPLDQYLIERAKRKIEDAYRERGYYLTDVTVDESELEERGLLIFKIIEGPRVRIKAVEFVGNDAFTSKQLNAEVKTRPHMFVLRSGVLDEEVITRDIGALDRFYKERGFLDVRVGHTIALSPDSREAKVTYLVDEGRQYTLRSVRAERVGEPDVPPEVFTEDQLAALISLKTGDVYNRRTLNESIEAIETAYSLLGYINARVQAHEIRRPEPVVDLVLEINEGEPALVGLVRINGNFLTKDKVIRRLIRTKPGRPFDEDQLLESERKIRATRLFNDVRITVQEPDPATPAYRDILVEVKERNTGSVNFGVALGSDSGIFGEISINQSNFDVADLPESPSELLSGRAFRGAGQGFQFVFRPGNEIFQYLVSLTEPHLFETDYSFTALASWRRRVYNQYDEERTTGRFVLDRRLGDIWRVSFSPTFERVKLTDIDSDAPLEVFRDAGPDEFVSLNFGLTRSTLDALARPTEGSRLESNFAVFGGDFNFQKLRADYSVFFTLDEDFLGRKTTFRLNTRVGYIFGGEAPTYEKFYMGGSSFRGFDFRTISPKGIRADTGEVGDDPVGGDWLFFLGGQVEVPLFKEVITGVAFVDSGTVTNDVGFDDYRLSIGLGVRLYIAALGPVPIAFDFGLPLEEQPGDETRTLTFSAALPF